MTTCVFDVAIVPDFAGAAARRFEIQTLFFLASWIEFGGRSKALPLHIACIGDAPESVRLLADRCGAEITSHPPEPQGRFANKFRGFEVNRKTDHLLLLDTDMLVLSDFTDLPDRLGPDCIAAAAANGPFPAARRYWPRLYEMLGAPTPKRQVLPLNLELDTYMCARFRDQTGFPPLYNGGVIFAPWRCELGERWREQMTHLARTATGVLRPKGIASNQPSLATAIAHLEERGFSFQLLPDEFHVRWQHLATGAVPLRKARLFHALRFARQNVDPDDATAKDAIVAFRRVLLTRTLKVRSHRSWTQKCASVVNLADWYRLDRLITRLYRKHVRELMP